MARPKGLKKTGGRVKGTPNKTTTNTRAWIGQLIQDNKQQIETDLKDLEPKDRLLILEKLMQYTVPKMQSIRANIDFNDLTDTQLDNIINELNKDL